MFPDQYMTQPCTITHVSHDGPKDEFGDATETTTTTVLDGLDGGCWVTDQRRDEDTNRTNQQRQIATGYFRPSTLELDGSDRVDVAGQTWEVEGPPDRPFNPLTGSVPYLIATLVRVV